jgi:hypothetical protein
MRAISIFYILVLFFLFSCAPIEVVKEITKATESIETSVKKMIKSKDKEKIEQEIIAEKKEISDEKIEQEIIAEKKEISDEQKKVSQLVLQQKKISTINLLGKNIQELNRIIGKPNLIRKDRKTTTFRFDSNNCRLFVFMKTTTKTSTAEYYELRNVKGKLIESKDEIESCFKEIKST